MNDLTGNVLCFFAPSERHRWLDDVHAATGLREGDFAYAADASAAQDEAAPAIVAPTLGVAVLRDMTIDRAARVAQLSRARVRRERWLTLPRMRDEEAPFDAALDGAREAFTWALLATGVDGTKLGGAGVRVAILDSGLDHTHPDLAGRFQARESFVAGSSRVDDDIGHGTHCAGTLFGPRQPASGPRYGIAPDVTLFAGRVAEDDGAGGRAAEGWVIAGVEWAITRLCRVVSLSVGRLPEAAPDADYEAIGARALAAGCLVITAAGNDSTRPNHVAPVRSPADAATFFSVGAANSAQRPVFDSNGGIRGQGGELNIAAPGAAMRSTWLGQEYRSKSGTSTATPVVAGIAALLLEENPTLSSAELWRELSARAAQVQDVPARDFGAGLVRVTA